MVFPRIRFLNLIVVLAAPRACFMMLKFKTLYGSPSSSMVIPFLMSDVSMATFNADFDNRADECPIGAGQKAAANPRRLTRSENRNMVNGYLKAGYREGCRHFVVQLLSKDVLVER